jgi:DNA end-binding protein Ku
LRPTGDGLMAHTLYEERDLNGSKDLFDGLAGIKLDPEMVQLASQLVERQSGKYDASDLEDRYESRLRAMIDAKLKGEGLDVSEPEEPARTNVVDLKAALKKSLGQETERKAPSKRKVAAKVTPIRPPQAASAKRKRA